MRERAETLKEMADMRAELDALKKQEPVPWRTFDGEGGYDYRGVDGNEGYRDEFIERNPNHATWVEPLYARTVPAQSVPDDVMRERVMEAVAEALGDAYDCTRVWSAWGYGTMGSDDFRLVANDPDRLHEIAEAAIQAVFAAALKPEEAK